MKQSVLDNIKVNILEEKVKDAIKTGTLDQKMSLLRMEAVEIGLADDDFKSLINNANKVLSVKEQTKKSIGEAKYLLFAIVAVLIVLEWVLPISLGWKIALSLLTIVVAIVVVSVTFYLKRKR